MNQKVIVADCQEIFRVGTARLLSAEDDLRIVGQCTDASQLQKAAEMFSGAILLCACSLVPEWSHLKATLDAFRCRVILVLENDESDERLLGLGFHGILYRSVSASELVACIRAIARGQRYVQSRPACAPMVAAPNPFRERARNRLTPKELQIISLLVQGYKNKEIAEELGNTEQVIKNYMRSIFNKTGVSDRLELALFTIQQKILLNEEPPRGRRNHETAVEKLR